MEEETKKQEGNIDGKKIEEKKVAESSFLAQENQRFSVPQKALLFAERKTSEKENKKVAGEAKTDDKKEKAEEKKTEKEDKKKAGEKKPKKNEAVVNAKDLPISTKHSIAICDFIRGKGIEEADYMLQEVAKMKKALPMKGEIPHRKGMMSGRYPVTACRVFIKLLRQLAANANVNGLEIEKARIECKANRASRPYRRFGSERFKRTHVTLKLKEKKALFGKETLKRKEKETKKQGEKK